MTVIEFNNVYNKYIKEGCSGLMIEHEEIINYLNDEFKQLIEKNKLNFCSIKIVFDQIILCGDFNQNDKNRIERTCQLLLNRKTKQIY